MNDRYLIELRSRILKCAYLTLAIFSVLFYFSDQLYTWFAQPILKQSPNGHLIATDITSLFTVPTKLSFFMAMFLSLPYLLYQIWSFIAPGLYAHEKRLLVLVVITSSVLFYLGVLFSYYVLCPLTLAFFLNSTPKGVQNMTDIQHYLDFMLTLLTAGGIGFQIPIITFFSVRLGWLTVTQLTYWRPYMIVGIFTLGMLLTPPDVISQILLALPMWCLFEIGILFAKKSGS